MPKRIVANNLNATTLDILNVIRNNAGAEYQANVPVIQKETDIPKIGEVLYGHPALANAFINALVNRIALVRVQSATFNNPYSVLKKGYLEFGETVEEIFVAMAKAHKYDPEKAERRELKRYLPEVHSAFHTMNWRVLYPVTIQDEDLKQAFLSMDGVQNLIAKIVDQVYTGAEYDEFLLFKYMLIKGISHGQFYPVSVGDATDIKAAGVQYRGVSNLFPFISSNYNEAGVANNTPKSRQIIFMDAMYNAQYDVEVLAGAFNMDKADYMGRLFLIDNWTTFDNERFDIIREESDGLEEVTAAELSLLADIKAVLVDENWFQVYDNNNKFTEKYVASGLYWNYFYHTWKTISHSPFSNAVCFVTSNANTTLPDTITVEVSSKTQSKEAITLTLNAEQESASLVPNAVIFNQTESLTGAGIAVQPYGALVIPQSQVATEITLVASVNGQAYTAAATITSAAEVGSTITLNKPVAPAAKTVIKK